MHGEPKKCKSEPDNVCYVWVGCTMATSFLLPFRREVPKKRRGKMEGWWGFFAGSGMIESMECIRNAWLIYYKLTLVVLWILQYHSETAQITFFLRFGCTHLYFLRFGVLLRWYLLEICSIETRQNTKTLFLFFIIFFLVLYSSGRRSDKRSYKY